MPQPEDSVIADQVRGGEFALKRSERVGSIAGAAGCLGRGLALALTRFRSLGGAL